MNTHYFASTLLALLPVVAHGQEAVDPSTNFEEILITGGIEQIDRLTGSATLLDEEKIVEFDITDVNKLLAQVPGVYIRYEDGYGLRPNIGIRGATSDRSQKITLMEDGILISPAPYSAPAAYYVPNVNRMSAIEVFKGPAVVGFGPHTVGGAINMATPVVDGEDHGFVDLSGGSYGAYKARVFGNKAFEEHGFWLDLMRYGADGFKELDNGQDTGFVRNDVNVKWQWSPNSSAGFDQQVVIKLGYADETSDETYLGLTEADFEDNPNRRYIGSAVDRFESEHTQVHGFYQLKSDDWQINNAIYLNQFDRSWNKFDGFFPLELGAEDAPYENRLSAADIFDPATPIIFLDLVRGYANSDGSLGQTLDITDNDREYGSHGISSEVILEKRSGQWQHRIKSGIRYHHDYVDRDHRVAGYWSIDGDLVNDGVSDYPNKALNRAESDALAIFVNDEIEISDLIFNVGLRRESIEGTYEDRLTGEDQSRSEEVWLPGFGIHYQWFESFSVLAGVNRGFSPNAPTAAADIDPEISVNYEYGFRYRYQDIRLDAIGFFSDYQNLLGRCRVSDPDCEAGEEFNGGDVQISGLELTGSTQFSLSGGLSVPLELVYTYSESVFQSDFKSSFSQWGDVQKGDQLPYLPEHQGRIATGLKDDFWAFSVAVEYVGKMREEAAQGTFEPTTSTKAYTTIDIAFHYAFSPVWSARLVADNILDEQEVVSRRPFGARPNAPRTINAGLRYEF